MIGALIAIAAYAAAAALICHAIADLFRGDHDGQAAAPEDGHPGSSDRDHGAALASLTADRHGWLPATLPLTPATPTLWRPRVSGGRVAGLQAVITVCDAAGWPVRSYSAGRCWPAQEGTA